MICQRCNAPIENERSTIYPICGYEVRGLSLGFVRGKLTHCAACNEWLHSLKYTFDDRLDGKPDPFYQYAIENAELSISISPDDLLFLLSYWKEERTPEEIRQILKGELPLVIDRVHVQVNPCCERMAFFFDPEPAREE